MKEILVDENGYNQFFKELDKLKKQSLVISSIGSEAYRDAIGDGWHDNYGFEESVRQSRNIAAKIEHMLKLKRLLRIVKKENNKSNLINIGDILKIKIIYSKVDVEETIIKLTGNYMPNVESDKNIQEITLNSPLGEALYLKSTEDKEISYTVNNNDIKIEIIERIKSDDYE